MDLMKQGYVVPWMYSLTLVYKAIVLRIRVCNMIVKIHPLGDCEYE